MMAHFQNSFTSGLGSKSNEVITKDPATPQTHRYTLPCET